VLSLMILNCEEEFQKYLDVRESGADLTFFGSVTCPVRKSDGDLTPFTT